MSTAGSFISYYEEQQSKRTDSHCIWQLGQWSASSGIIQLFLFPHGVDKRLGQPLQGLMLRQSVSIGVAGVV